MGYQEELRAKLDAVHLGEDVKKASIVDISAQEKKILDELDGEFEFGRYDLDESDIFRTLKILDILQNYQEVFQNKNALKLFYVLCRVDAITVKNLHNYMKLPSVEFKEIINKMAKNRLIAINECKELELTLDGQSLASRIGINIFL